VDKVENAVFGFLLGFGVTVTVFNAYCVWRMYR